MMRVFCVLIVCPLKRLADGVLAKDVKEKEMEQDGKAKRPSVYMEESKQNYLPMSYR